MNDLLVASPTIMLGRVRLHPELQDRPFHKGNTMPDRLATIMFAVGLAIAVGCSQSSTPEVVEDLDVEVVEPAHPDVTNILGLWKIVSSEREGEPNEDAIGNFFTFENGQVKAWIREFGSDVVLTYELDPSTSPKHLTAKIGRPPNDRIYTGIYELDGDSLKSVSKIVNVLPVIRAPKKISGSHTNFSEPRTWSSVALRLGLCETRMRPCRFRTWQCLDESGWR